MTELIFCRNKNILKSFLDSILLKNKYEPRWHFWLERTSSVLFLLILFGGMAYLNFIDGGDLVFNLVLFGGTIFFLIILLFISHLVNIRDAVKNKIDSLKFIDSENKFSVVFKADNSKESFAFSDVKRIYIPQKSFSEIASFSIRSFFEKNRFFSTSDNFLYFVIEIENESGNKTLKAPFYIERVYEAIDIIIQNVSPGVGEDLRFINGHLVKGWPAKSPLGVDLGTKKGRMILVGATIVCIGFMLLLVLSIERLEWVLDFFARIFFGI